MKKIQPPRLADHLFSLYCKNELRESILGDLHEQFYQDVKKKGLIKAKLIYWFTVLKFFNRFTTGKKNQSSNPFIMKSYIKDPFRFLAKNKTYTLINIAGLSIAIVSCLLIFYFLHHELSFDQQHTKNIYRINFIYADNSGTETKMVNSPPMLAPGIRGNYPELLKASQLRYTQRSTLRNGDKVFYEDYGFYADSSFLEMFSFPAISGDVLTALDAPNSLVITKKLAEKYFGDQDPMGRTILMNGEMNLEVTAILDDIPTNSHIRFDFLVSFSTYQIPSGYRSDLTSWSWLGFLTYVELTPEADPMVFQGKLDAKFVSLFPKWNTPFKTIVQPLDDIYMGSSELVDDLASHLRMGDKSSIYALTIIAVLILFIACFNLVNLTTAISLTRGKEIGVKKVLGIEKTKLISQVILESVFIACFSALIAYGIGLLLFPKIKQLLSWDLELDYLTILYSIPIIFSISIAIGIITGLYPSLLLSNLNGAQAIKSGFKSSKGTNRMSNGLIGLQFFIAISLITATFTVHNQLKMVRNASLGIESEQVVAMKLLPQDMNRYFDRFKENLSQNSQILNVSRSERIVGDPWPVNSILVVGEDPSESKQISGNLVGYDFLETFGINLTQGRSFSREIASDSLGAIIINEACAKFLGLEDPIGTNVNFFSIDGPRTVIGVMEDFNFSSLHHEIGPAVIILPFLDFEHLYIEVAPGNLLSRLNLIEEQWKNITNGAPLEIQLMDDHLNRLYQNEEKLSHLITGFSLLAVFLSCLGLYGLIAFVVNKKLKEIGIRKVLGASVPSLLMLFSKRFVLIISVSALLAAPIIYYIMSLWLDGFAYRISFNWSTVLLAMVVLTLISVLTIGHQTLKTVLQNPVDVLRDE